MIASMLAGAILLVLPAMTCAFAGEHLPEAVPRTPGANPALSLAESDRTLRSPRDPIDSGPRFEVGVGQVRYRNLGEPYQFSPAAIPAAPGATAWERQWREDELRLRAGYGFRVGDHLLLRPGIALGAARGWFEAGNAGIGFSEAWRTRLAVLGGLSLEAELRADPGRGPFLMAQYRYRRAGAGEAHETVVSKRASNPDNRDARFRWQEHEAIAGVGWRWGALRPVAGVSYTDFRLKKWLRHHIPEAGTSGIDLELVRALNSEESEYHYENKNPWAPFLELGWQAGPSWALAARGTLAGSDDYGLSLSVGF